MNEDLVICEPCCPVVKRSPGCPCGCHNTRRESSQTAYLKITNDGSWPFPWSAVVHLGADRRWTGVVGIGVTRSGAIRSARKGYTQLLKERMTEQWVAL